MPTQAQIERAVGITPALAYFINAHPTEPQVRVVTQMLGIQVRSFDPAGMALLTEAARELAIRLAAADLHRSPAPAGR